MVYLQPVCFKHSNLMSETNIPDAVEPVQAGETADVTGTLETSNPQGASGTQETSAPQEAQAPSLADKSLAELVKLFESLMESADRMKRSKEAEAIKSAFYKLLNKEKSDAGEGFVNAPKSNVEDEPQAAGETGGQEESHPAAEENPQEETQAAEEGDSLEEAQSVGEDKPQTEHPADEAKSGSALSAIEEVFKGLYSEYKKARAEYNRQQDAEREANCEAKLAVIEDLKALLDKQEDLGASFPAFREIQDRWRAIGPVPATRFRDINDQYQYLVERFYDMVKINHELRDLDFKKNLEAKEAFCEAAEKLAENDNVVEAFHELQKLHEQWKEFGPVAKEYRDSIWERFKAATAVINKKYQAHFEELKDKQAENLAAKEALCVRMEEIAAKDVRSSGEWNSLTKEIEKMQAEWKTIGFASKKDNRKIYARFRTACDVFFARKRDFYTGYKETMNDNLRRKTEIVEAAEALKDSTDWKKTADALIDLQRQWKEIGMVPRKKSEQLWQRFRAACDEFFGQRDKYARQERRGAPQRHDRRSAPRSEKDVLVQKYRALQQDIDTYENNIGFFAASKNAAPLIDQMRRKIEDSKRELGELELKIRQLEQSAQDNG